MEFWQRQDVMTLSSATKSTVCGAVYRYAQGCSPMRRRRRSLEPLRCIRHLLAQKFRTIFSVSRLLLLRAPHKTLCALLWGIYASPAYSEPIDDLRGEVATRVAIINAKTNLLVAQANLANAAVHTMRGSRCFEELDYIENGFASGTKGSAAWLRQAYLCRASVRDSFVEIDSLRSVAIAAATGVVGTQAYPPESAALLQHNIAQAATILVELDKVADRMTALIKQHVPQEPKLCKPLKGSGESFDAASGAFIAARNRAQPAAMKQAIVRLQATYWTLRSRAIYCTPKNLATEAFIARKTFLDLVIQASTIEAEIRRSACELAMDAPHGYEACLNAYSSLESDAVLDAINSRKGSRR